jgi:hypothetical protein
MKQVLQSYRNGRLVVAHVPSASKIQNVFAVAPGCGAEVDRNEALITVRLANDSIGALVYSALPTTMP